MSSDRNRPITVREIASQCSYSHSTVALALRNHPRIPAKTCQKIQALARKMGWKPNPMAAAFMAHIRSSTKITSTIPLAFFSNSSTDDTLKSLPYYQQYLFWGARQKAQQLGYSLDFIWIKEPGLTAKRLKQILLTRNIQGLLIPGIPEHNIPPSFHSFDCSPFACVLAGFSLSSSLNQFHSIHHDLTTSVNISIEQSRRLGYQRIGIISTTDDEVHFQNSILAPASSHFLFSQRKDLITPCLISWDSDTKGKKILEKWVSRYQPDIIVGHNWRLHDHLVDIGLRIPEEVAYMVLNRIPERKDIAGINQCPRRIGEWAVESLVAQLLRNERGIPNEPKIILCQGIWEKGPSAPPKK